MRILIMECIDLWIYEHEQKDSNGSIIGNVTSSFVYFFGKASYLLYFAGQMAVFYNSIFVTSNLNFKLHNPFPHVQIYKHTNAQMYKKVARIP